MLDCIVSVIMGNNDWDNEIYKYRANLHSDPFQSHYVDGSFYIGLNGEGFRET